MSFCEAPPTTPLTQKYLWSLYAQVRSCSSVGVIKKELALFTAHKGMFDGQAKGLKNVHRQFIEQPVANLLNMLGAAPCPGSMQQCVDKLCKMLEPLVSPGDEGWAMVDACDASCLRTRAVPGARRHRRR